ALDECGYGHEAERTMAFARARLSGDYLQTSAIFDEQLGVLSLVTDPNDYAGPGTGYEPAPSRQAEIDAIRQARGVADLRAEQAGFAVPLLAARGPALPGQGPRDVVIGVSPAVGRDVWRCLSGLAVTDVLREMLAGSDFAFSGFGSIQRYDNMFGPSNFNAEDIDDFLAMQRDWGIDGGLRTVDAARLAEVRREAAEACRAVYAHLGLADFTDEHVELAVDAAGSKDLGETDTLAVLAAAQAIRQRGLTVVDIVAALDECGYGHEAERTMAFARARLSGDYLQTSAIFDEQLGVLSLVTDPNDYAGPGTGYEPSPSRQAEIDAIRQARGVADLRAEQARFAVPLLLARGPALPGQGPRDVVIGVSPAVGRDVWRCLSGLAVTDVLREMLAGLEEEGCTGRVVRFGDSVDLGRIGLAAARLAGSGIGIGLQGKGTALIHRRDLAPLANLELYSVAPSVTAGLYRLLGANAARHAKGGTPDPARNPYSDEAIEARYHTTVIALMALERAWVKPGLPAE
ncbi:MAG TPA: propanediol/glycerol family dehydratase large subunit, partial [Streptosporangiaceae bacterium]|nr:propanediol/glycerol family dehydratase large subunit [Streptosporangiaceae bacterium]